jgi:hypothetical protein
LHPIEVSFLNLDLFVETDQIAVNYGIRENDRLRVALLFGGRSAEHDVSCASAANVLRALDPNRYNIKLIGITRDGRWILANGGNGAGDGASALSVPEQGPQVALVPGARGRLVVVVPDGNSAPVEGSSVDVAFPVSHGPNGRGRDRPRRFGESRSGLRSWARRLRWTRMLRSA